ncbi:MAG TPA: TfoX/Sxy family protein [Steroidobacteraceae bacterium]|nr:TfoX/Sxy family protein [Steroidobacteraceae bacterium]
MTISADFLAYVLDQLQELGDVSARRMFGGAGLYCDEFFFALIADHTLYLRVDDSNRGDYLQRAAQPFRPYADRPHLSMSYYEAPAEVLEDARQLSEWARRSVAVAMRAPTPRENRRRRGRSGRRRPRTARAAER